MKKLLLLGACLWALAVPGRALALPDPAIIVVRIYESGASVNAVITRGEGKDEKIEFDSGGNDKGLIRASEGYYKLFARLYGEGYVLQSTISDGHTGLITLLLLKRNKPVQHSPGLFAGKPLPYSGPGLRRLPAAVWLALLLAHALAFGYALRSGHYRFPDTDRYLQAAQNIAQHGQLYARPWPASPPTGQAVQEFTIRPPGYPLLALSAPLGILLVQNTLSIGALALVLGGWAASRARPPGRGAWAAVLLLALSFPAQLIYANALMSEVPLQATLLLGAGLAARLVRTGRARYAAGLAAALVAAWLLKPVAAPSTVAVALLVGGLAWRRRRPLLALLGALPLLLALAYMGWNWQRTGYFHLSSITDINLLHYNAAGVLRQAEGPAAEDAWLAAPCAAPMRSPRLPAGSAPLRRPPGRAAALPLALRRAAPAGHGHFLARPRAV